ncbi:MAG: Nif3-like dinuclear metal center hexameric protein, partial [Gemmatimonadetes bacterium]|nr:Nif3-like dinuclear metal center hexameric protein [Gemmatimonadota bacterium]
MHRDELVSFLDELLDVHSIEDFGPQGLQVEGKDDVRKVAVGVTASIELFRRAAEWGADAVICHHGMLWDFDPRIIKGPLRERLRILFDHGISLLGYHLVLDAHEEHGNNALLARELGLTDVEPFAEYRGHLLGRRGRFDPPLSHTELEARVKQVLGGDPLMFGFGPDPVRTLGLVTGGAVNDFRQAIDAGLDAYLTGEVKEHVQELAREEKVTYVSAGHYRTETF